MKPATSHDPMTNHPLLAGLKKMRDAVAPAEDESLSWKS
jgi:hypothetical protein